MGEILKSYTVLAEVPPAAPANPLTTNETERLNFLLKLAHEGGPFTHEEVQEYQDLVDIGKRDGPKDDNYVWALIGLGALLVGIYLLGKKDEGG
jgi:hypothetical protein